MSIICKTEGIKGVYSGIRPRMVHYVINSIFTCTILEKLETNLLNNSHWGNSIANVLNLLII